MLLLCAASAGAASTPAGCLCAAPTGTVAPAWIRGPNRPTDGVALSGVRQSTDTFRKEVIGVATG